MLHCGGIWRVKAQNFRQLRMKGAEALRQIIAFGMKDAIGHMRNARAQNINHAPAQIPQARVDPQNTHPCPLFSFSQG
jgi:hypothetical protein